MIRFRSISIALVVAALSVSAHAQGTTGGLLYASDFANWSLPQGNTPMQGTIFYPNPNICQVTSNGYTFLAAKVGRPLTIVDGINTETFTPTAVTITTGVCMISGTMARSHSSYSIKSGTAGAQEAIDYQASQPQGANIVLTPTWTQVGGSTGIVTGTLKGNTGVTILDQRTSQLTAYTWGGSAYIPNPFATIAGGSVVGNCAIILSPNSVGTTGAPCGTASNPAGPAFAVQLANSGVSSFQGDPNITINPTSHTLTSANLLGGTIQGTLQADQHQSGGGNNGIANSLTACLSQSYVCQIQAPALYALTEAQPFGAAPTSFFTPPLIAGPTAAQSVGGFLDSRYGVPQWIFNQSVPLNNRFMAAPTITMNNITGPGQGLSPHYAQSISLQSFAFAGGRNMYNLLSGYGDKAEFDTLGISTYKYTQNQIGGNLNQIVNCPGNGDCITQVNNPISSGGPNMAGDEGTRGYVTNTQEGPTVYQGTIASITTAGDGTATLTTTPTQSSGAQGEGRLVLDMTTVYNGVAHSNYIASIAAVSNDLTVTCGGTCDWDGTYGTSTKTLLTALVGNGVSTTNTFPQSNVNLAVTSSTGFSVGGIACLYNYDFECEKITAVPDGTHVTVATIRIPHFVGDYVTTGGLAGYSLEFEADRVNPASMNGIGGPLGDTAITDLVRWSIPIMYSSGGNSLVLLQGTVAKPGASGSGSYVGRAVPTMGSGISVAITVAGNIVTACTPSGGSGYITNGPPAIVFAGSWGTSPVAHLTGFSGGTFTTCSIDNAGVSVVSATATAPSSNPYDIYQTTKVTNVYNATTGTVDGTLQTEPLIGTWNTADLVESPHWFVQQAIPFYGGRQQWIPTLVNKAASGLDLEFAGLIQGNDTPITVNNHSDPTIYKGYPAGVPWALGRGQLSAPVGLHFMGSWGNMLQVDTPPYGNNANESGVIQARCGTLGCAAWNTPWNLWFINGNGGNETIAYTPSIRLLVTSAGEVATQSGSPIEGTILNNVTSCGLTVCSSWVNGLVLFSVANYLNDAAKKGTVNYFPNLGRWALSTGSNTSFNMVEDTTQFGGIAWKLCYTTSCLEMLGTGALVLPSTQQIALGDTLAKANTVNSFSALQTLTAGANLSGASSPLQVGGSAGTSGQVLTSAGAGATPIWSTPTGVTTLCKWNTPTANTGSTANTQIAGTSCKITGGLMAASSQLRLKARYGACTASTAPFAGCSAANTGTCTPHIYTGANNTATTNHVFTGGGIKIASPGTVDLEVVNLTTSSQLSDGFSLPIGAGSATSGSPTTASAYNTASDMYLNFFMVNSVSADQCYLTSYTVELIP